MSVTSPVTGRVTGIVTSGVTRAIGHRTRVVKYYDPAASGENDGSSWSNAYTSFQTALDSISDGGILRTNSTRSTKERGGFSLNKNNVTIVTNSGPDGETWITSARYAAWADAGDGVFTLATETKPNYVAFDMQQDTDGSVTGFDVTAATWAAPNEVTDFAVTDRHAWYGFLVENTATPTSPGSGEWGFSGGTLYLNPPGSPSLAEVDSKAEYFTDAINGLEIYGSGNKITGRLIGYQYPVFSSNAGYAVKGMSGSNNEIKGLVAINTGWHAAGFANNSLTGHKLTQCLSNGSWTIPWIFYIAGGSADAKHVASDLTTVLYPPLASDGKALTGTNWKTMAGFSHSSGADLRGIQWHRISVYDLSGTLLKSTGEVLDAATASVASGNLVQAGNVGDADWQDGNTFGVTVFDSAIAGRYALPSSFVATLRCKFDRRAFGTTAYRPIAASIGGGSNRYFLDDCEVWTGDFDGNYIGFLSSSASRFLYAKNTDFHVGNVTARSGVSGCNTFAAACLNFNGCTIQQMAEKTGQLCVERNTSPGGTTLPIEYILAAGNTFHLDASLQHSNLGVAIQTPAWWTTNVGPTDTFIAP